MVLDVPRRHLLGVHGDDLLLQPGDVLLALFDDHEGIKIMEGFDTFLLKQLFHLVLVKCQWNLLVSF